MKLLNFKNIYDNPLPQLKSRQSYFPNLCETDDGKLLCCFTIGEAMEAVDCCQYISESSDNGETWSEPRLIFAPGDIPENDAVKLTNIGGGRIMAFGYRFIREDPSKPQGNPETGGLLPDEVFYSVSEDGGKTFGEKIHVPEHWNGHTEASGELKRLKNGALAAPITGFPQWDGTWAGRNCGRLLVTEDEGKTWNDDTVCMEFPGDNVTCYEQRICVLESGTIVNIGWNEDVKEGKRLPNHITYSDDNGKTFSAPIDTGIMGQASSVCALGGEKFIAIVSRRRDTDEPGVYGYVVDFSGKTFNVTDEAKLWGPEIMTRAGGMAEIFAFLKFGQPSLFVTKAGRKFLLFWYAKEGQYSIGFGEVEI